MYLAPTDDYFCMILNCIYCIIYCCIYYVCNNLVALLKFVQYVRIKKYIIINIITTICIVINIIINVLLFIIIIILIIIIIVTLGRYEYLGCYRDSTPRDLSGPRFGSANLTFKLCAEHCKDYEFLALQVSTKPNYWNIK